MTSFGFCLPVYIIAPLPETPEPFRIPLVTLVFVPQPGFFGAKDDLIYLTRF